MARPIHVLVHMASGLRGTGTLVGAPRPYVVLSIGGERYRTRTRHGHDPTWNEEFVFGEGCHEQGHPDLVVNVFNSRSLMGDCFVGSCRINIADTVDGSPVGCSYPLTRKDFPETTGAVIVAVSSSPIGAIKSAAENSGAPMSSSSNATRPASAAPYSSSHAAAGGDGRSSNDNTGHTASSSQPDHRPRWQHSASVPPATSASATGGRNPNSFAPPSSLGLSDDEMARRLQQEELLRAAAAATALPHRGGGGASVPVSLGAMCARCRSFNPWPHPGHCRACRSRLLGEDEVFATVRVDNGWAPQQSGEPVLGYPAHAWPPQATAAVGGRASGAPAQLYHHVGSQVVQMGPPPPGYPSGTSGHQQQDAYPQRYPPGYVPMGHNYSASACSGRRSSNKGLLAAGAGLLGGLILGDALF